MASDVEKELAQLREKLLLMASHAEAAASRAVKSLLRRDDDLARRTKDDDELIDRLEMEIDELTLRLLGRSLDLPTVRLVTIAMKIALDLERVGDEATTISRRSMELAREPELSQAVHISRMAQVSLGILKDALDGFVHRDTVRARRVIAHDREVDEMYHSLHKDLVAAMEADPGLVRGCLHLLVIAKSLERVADHATNIAEMVVYLQEGRDIRHHRDS